MKTSITTVLLFVMALMASCKKNNTTTSTIYPDYFIFGSDSNMCVGCSSYYYTANKKVYATHNPNLNDSILSATAPMGADAYAAAEKLMQTFPVYLVNRPDTNFLYNRTTLEPFRVLYLEYKQNGIKRKWSIDGDTSLLPVEIRTYIFTVKKTIDNIK